MVEARQEEYNHQRSDDFLFHAGGSCVIDSTTSLSSHSNDTRLMSFFYSLFNSLIYRSSDEGTNYSKNKKEFLKMACERNSSDQMTITRKQRKIDKGSLLVIDAWLNSEVLKLLIDDSCKTQIT